MIICSSCKQSNENTSAFCNKCGSKITQLVQSSGPQSFLNILPNGEISVRATSVPEAKFALKELKLKKKEFTLLKKQLSEQERQIRAAYADEVRRRGTRFQGGGGVGKFFRLAQTASRDAARHNLAEQLAPFEQQKIKIEAMRSAIDQLVLQVEMFIHNNS